jgi:hypothetical protein
VGILRTAGTRCARRRFDYVGHYRLKLIDFWPTRLAVEIERKSNTHVDVSYALDAVEFNKASPIVNIIFDRHR